MTLSILRVLEFSQLLLKLQEVMRHVRIPRRKTPENDVEHSYQLAMMAWYINDANELDLSADRLLRYALVHDIAEAYAGDVHIFDHVGREGKAEREAAALKQVEADFPEFPELVRWVHEYERRQDPESKFIYALDKLMPMIMVYLEGGTTWHELNFSLEETMSNKAHTTLGSSEIHDLSWQLEALIRLRPELFPRS